MVVLSDKTARFHPRHIVLKPTQSDEFKMPIRCEWISHRPIPTSKSDFHLLLLVVVRVVAGAQDGSWPWAVGLRGRLLRRSRKRSRRVLFNLSVAARDP